MVMKDAFDSEGHLLSKRYSYHVFILLFLLYLFDYMGRLAVVALFPFLQRDRGLTDTQCGPERVNFLRHRPVFSNRRPKEEYGYTPRKTKSGVSQFFMECRKSGD
jgi:hypothetical protein